MAENNNNNTTNNGSLLKNADFWTAVAQAGVSGVGQLAAQGNQHVVGNIFKGAAPALNAIPVWGPLASVAADAVGSGINALWGWDLDENAIAGIKALQNQVKNVKANTSNTTSLARQYSVLPSLGTVKTSDIGSDGIFSNHVKKRAQSLTRENTQANMIGASNLNTGVNTLKSNMLSSYQKSLANGGFLDSAIGYNFLQQSLLNQEQRANNTMNKITSMPNSFNNNEFALGGQRNGGYFSNGLTYIGEGGTHEQNPHEGVLMGYDEEGTPNLVEEGEYVWNDYVFSNRTKVPKQAYNIFGLGGKKNGYTFAEAVNFIQKESEERPTDPISAKGLAAMLSKLAMLQEELRQKQTIQENQNINLFSGGGDFDNDNIYDFTDDAIYGTKGNDGKYTHGEDWNNIIKLLEQHPEYISEIFSNAKQYLDSDNIDKNSKRYAFYQELLKDKNLKKYVDSGNLDSKTAKTWKSKYSDGAPGLYYKIARAAAAAHGNSGLGNMLIRVMNQTTDDNGKIKVVPIEYKGQPLILRGTKEDIIKQLNAINPDNNLTLMQELQNEGINIDPKQFEKGLKANKLGDDKVDYNGDKIVAGGQQPKDQYTPYQMNITQKAPVKKAKTTYLDSQGKVFDPNLIYTDPKYKNWTLTGKVTDSNTGDENWYYGPKDSQEANPLASLRFSAIPYNFTNFLTDVVGLTNKPNYSLAEGIENLNLSTPSIGSSRVGTRLRFDATSPYVAADMYRDNYLSTKSSLEQTSPNSPNLAASLIGLNYQNNIARGKAFADAVKANRDQYNNVLLQNANIESNDNKLALSAAQSNQSAASQDNARILDQMYKGAVFRQAEDTAISDAVNTNANAFIQDLTDIGREYTQRNWINTNNAFNYGMGDFGEITFKDFFSNPELVQQALSSIKQKKYGGYLTIKN